MYRGYYLVSLNYIQDKRYRSWWRIVCFANGFTHGIYPTKGAARRAIDKRRA
jgi:hypothetical protein